MSEPLLISILIPAFNAEATLAESLESVRSQTFADFEAIIVDDGSTDATAAIAERFCATDPRFKLVRQANGGASAARNAAFAQSRGNWIAFQDADDVWLPEKLARQVELLRGDPRANLLFTNLYIWNGKEDLYASYRPGNPLPDGDTTRRLIFVDVYCNATVIVPRESLAAAGPFDPELRFSQDWDMWLRIADRGLWARGVPEPMVRYRRWPGSRTHENNRLAVADANVRLLEKNLERTRRPEFRPLYRRSLASARAIRELVLARPLIETAPAAIPAAVLRAWRCEPKWKWLRWYLLLVWPALLGGHATRRMVHQKIIRKWSGP